MRNFFTTFLSTFIVLIFLSVANAQSIKRPRFDSGVDLSQEAASERWHNFISSGLGGDYCMLFEIKHRPRRGEEIKYIGSMFGAQRGNVVFTRISVAPASHPKDLSVFILKNSPTSAEVWKFNSGKFEKLSKEDWFKPMLNGLIYSPFDLLMPYKFWSPKYVGAERVGQAVHSYDLTSADFPARTIRVSLTRDFNAPAQIQVFDGSENTRTARLGSVKRVDGLWIMREASVKDEVSKDKDILKFTHAKLNLRLNISIFSPDSKAEIELPALPKL